MREAEKELEAALSEAERPQPDPTPRPVAVRKGRRSLRARPFYLVMHVPKRNTERDFHGEKRRNDTHASTTDPDARLFRKAAGKEAKLCYMGHLMMENRNSLIVDAD